MSTINNKANIDHLFARMDVNQDGELSAQELQDFLVERGVSERIAPQLVSSPFNPEDFMDSFDRGDAQGQGARDGKVSLDEMRRHIHTLLPEDLLDSAGSLRPGAIREFVISLAEIAAVEGENPSNANTEISRERLRAFINDEVRDNVAGGVRFMMGHNNLVDAAKFTLYALFDANEDGILTLGELDSFAADMERHLLTHDSDADLPDNQ